MGLIVSIKFKLKLQLVKLPETSETVIVISVSERVKKNLAMETVIDSIVIAVI